MPPVPRTSGDVNPMARQYSPRTSLRQVPNQLLKQFFDACGLLPDFIWYTLRETETELIYQAWQALPQAAREDIESAFRAVHEVACEAGVKAVAEEAAFLGDDIVTQFGELTTEIIEGYESLGVERIVLELPTEPRDETLRRLDDLAAQFAKLT